MTADGGGHGPGMRLPPPLIVAVVLAVAWLLDRLVPVPIGSPLGRVGLVVMALGVALTGCALALRLRTRTDPRPGRPDQALVRSGPLRASRNPIYLGFLLFAIGLALRWASLWGWLAVAAAFVLLDRLVVACEERYLRARFGDDYADYAARVRRWL
jgi:protein-S-isoprenylcysteine O-methyltransferase Ste14